MRKMFKGAHDIMLYRERTEEEEFGRAPKNFRLCRICNSVYFNKSWHHFGEVRFSENKKRFDLIMTLCPACRMGGDNQYEGAVTINNIPRRLANELQNLIKAFTRRAYERDCQHRLISITRLGQQTWKVLTTENQLANKLAQKIRDVFDKVDVKVAYSKAPDDVERVTVSFWPAFGQAS